MAHAFHNAGFKVPAHLLNGKSGWNAKLSFRTFKKLESEGYTKFSS